jgi:hypothetical protein
MGLDMYAHTRNQKIDFGKVFEDDYNPCKHGFYWRKHSRLQTFMARKFEEVNDTTDDFNGQELVLTKEIISDLRKEIDSDYWESFCSGGFFWGHQYQEQSVKQYSQQDKLFCDWALTQLEKGEEVIYSCSW